MIVCFNADIANQDVPKGLRMYNRTNYSYGRDNCRTAKPLI